MCVSDAPRGCWHIQSIARQLIRDVTVNIWQTTLPMTRQHPVRPAIYLVLACLLAVAVYFPGLSGDYVFDDMQNLLTNPRLPMKELNLETLQAASFSSSSGRLKRPVSMFTFALNRYFFGVSPWSYKIINLLIHLMTGVALYWLGTLIMKSYRRLSDPSLSPATETWLPLAICTIWLVHPLNLTGVLYIVQRMTSLTALFTVLGLCCYMVGRSRLLDRQSGWPWIFAGLFGFGGLALLSKENGVLLPCYMFVLELALFRFRGPDDRAPDRAVAAYFGVFLLLPALLFLLLLVVQPLSLLGGYSGRDFTLVERVMTQARVLMFYLKQIVAPSISELGLYHDDIAISRGLLDPPATLYASLAISLLLVTGLGLLKRLPLVGLGILWFFCGHLLESTILPLEIAHEHRNYLADFGIILALGGLVAKLPGKRLAPHIRYAAPAIFIALLSYTTWVRAGQWSDNVTHAVYEAMHHPQSPRAVHGAGRIHARLAIYGREGSTEKAYYYLERASEINESGILPDIVMVKLAFLLDIPVKQEWYDRILTKLRLHSINSADLNGLHELSSCQQGICKTPREIMEAIYATVLNHESLRNAGGREAHAYTSYGFYLINVHGEFRNGLDYLYKAVEAQPDAAQNRINLIKALVAMRQYGEAEQQLELFRAAAIPGTSARDFNRLSGMIDDARRQQAEQANSNTVAEKHE
jgi:hypothetical protein